MPLKTKRILYSKIGKAFLQVIRPDIMKDLLYEVLALLNKGVDTDDFVQRQTLANLNLFVVSRYCTDGSRQAGEMASKNASFQAAIYYLKCAISYFGLTTWHIGKHSILRSLIQAYPKMYQAHLLLAQAMLAEGDLLETRQFVKKTLPYVSHIQADRAAFLSVTVKSWLRDEYCL